MTDRYASANGIGIHLADHPGGEPPIVLLPGITANLHNFDGLIAAGPKPEHIFQVALGVQAEDWPAIFAAVTQPAIFFSGPMPIAGPGSPAVISAEAARQAAAVLPDCRSFHEVPGNHWTMVYGEGARQIVDAVTAFLRA